METLHLQLAYLKVEAGLLASRIALLGKGLRITPSQTFKKIFTPTPKTNRDAPDFFLCSHESPVLFLPGGLVKLSGFGNQEAQA